MKKKLFAMTLATVLTASCFLGVTMQSEAASWQANGSRWWYSEDNGSYPANAWRFIDNAWYHFDNWGYMQTGWQVINGSWYYFYNNGAMAANQSIGNYFVDPSDVWQQIHGLAPILLAAMERGFRVTVPRNGS